MLQLQQTGAVVKEAAGLGVSPCGTSGWSNTDRQVDQREAPIQVPDPQHAPGRSPGRRPPSPDSSLFPPGQFGIAWLSRERDRSEMENGRNRPRTSRISQETAGGGRLPESKVPVSRRWSNGEKAGSVRKQNARVQNCFIICCGQKAEASNQLFIVPACAAPASFSVHLAAH